MMKFSFKCEFPSGCDLLVFFLFGIGIALPSLSCKSSGSPLKEVDVMKELVAEDACPLNLFRVSFEHVVSVSPILRRAPYLRGHILSAEGPWPGEGDLALEVVGVSGDYSKVIPVESHGFFNVEDIPEGKYCYKASADGWNSEIGLVEINRLQRGEHLTIILSLGF